MKNVPSNSWLKQTFIHYQYWQSYLRQSKKLADLLKLTKNLLGGSVCDIISCNFFSGAADAPGEANLLLKGMSKQCIHLVLVILYTIYSFVQYLSIDVSVLFVLNYITGSLSKLSSYYIISFHYKTCKNKLRESIWFMSQIIEQFG